MVVVVAACQFDGTAWRWRRDPATACPAGFTYTGGSCQSIATYASAVPTGYGIVSRNGGCPAGYTQYTFTGYMDHPGNPISITSPASYCVKN